MPGIAGQFFKQFGITVSVQVMFSLLAAQLITPMLAAYFLSSHAIHEPPPGFVLRTYTRVVTWSVRHYLTTVVIGVLLFAASLWSVGLLPKSFMPDVDESKSRLAIELPPGSQLSDTERMTEEITAKVRQRPEVKSVFVDGGRVPKGPKEFAARQSISITRRKRNVRVPSANSNSLLAAISKTSLICGTGSSMTTVCGRSAWTLPALTTIP